MCAVALALLLMAAPSSALKDRWERMGTNDFEVYTNAGDKAAREALQHLQQVRGFFLKASPLPLYDEFPVRIVVFKGPEQLREYTTSDQRVAFFASSLKRDYIVMSDSPDEYRAAIHEYVHLIVRHSGLRLPTWLNEGWAEVYSTLKEVDDGVAVGDLIDGRLHALVAGKWIGFDRLTTIDPESPAYQGNGAETEMFYAESWALAHMLFLSPDYSGRFRQFLIAIHHGRSFDEACREAFGKSGQDVYADLRKYFERKNMFGRVFKAPLGTAPSSVPAEKVDPFDVRLVLADLLGAIGRRQDARDEYSALNAQRPNRFEVADSLGYLALAERNGAEAISEWERAFAAGDSDPRMCYQLAVLEREAHRPDSQVVAALERAVQSKPSYADALLQLGLMRISARDYGNGVAALLSIEKIAPEQATPVYSALAYGNLQLGDLARARKDLETAKQYARGPDETRKLDGISVLIEARSRLPLPPRPGEKLVRVQGALRAVDCSSGGNRMALTVGDRTLVLDLPDPKAVEFIRPGITTLNLACGPQKPMSLTVEYAAASVVDKASEGVVRRLEF